MHGRPRFARFNAKHALRKSLALAAVLGCTALSGGTLTRSAHADSFSMAAGMQTNSGPLCFSFGVLDGNVGVYKSVEDPECFFQSYVMPLYWRNFYSAGTNRTVQVRGRAHNSNVWMGCSLSVYNSNGVLVSSDSEVFPVTGSSYATISLTVNNVLSSSTSVVRCEEAGTEPGKLVKVDYSP